MIIALPRKERAAEVPFEHLGLPDGEFRGCLGLRHRGSSGKR